MTFATIYEINEEIAQQTAAFTASSAAVSTAFGAQTYCVRLIADQNCFIKFAGTPTATTSDTFMPALSVEYFKVHPGQKVAAIRDTTNGTLYVSEMC